MRRRRHANRRDLQAASSRPRTYDGRLTRTSLDERVRAAGLPPALVALLHEVVRLLNRYAGTEQRAGPSPPHAERRRPS